MIIAAAFSLTNHSQGASGDWNIDADGNWNTPSNWNPAAVPGTAAGDVVYVNYARPEDFAELTKRGISLKGKIALARYGQNFRGASPIWRRRPAPSA